MNVLLISHAYPPYPASGSRRAKNVADALLRHGHSVTVLTARLPAEGSHWRTHSPNLRVAPVSRVVTPRHLYLSLKRHHVKEGGAKSNRLRPLPAYTSVPEQFAVATAPTWKRYLISFLTLPDKEQGFIPPAVLRGLRELRAGADLLYTTGPPISTHLTGLLLKRITGAPWVAEFRDPWVVDGVPLKPPNLRSPLADGIHRRLYHRCLAAADRLVAVTAATARVLAGDLPSSHDKVILARNGIPVLVPRERGKRESRTFLIVHLGDLYGLRDPRPFFEALATVRDDDRGRDLPPLRVEMVGHYDEESVEFYQRMSVDLGIDRCVRFRDWVSFEEGQNLLARADLLLLLAQRQPLQVPNKLYEYLGHRKPILAFADGNGETATMLRTSGGHYLVTDYDDRKQVARTVRAAIRGDSEGRLPGETDDAESLLESWSTRTQLDHLLAQLSTLVPTTRSAS